jgi:uncharacterized protein YjdB
MRPLLSSTVARLALAAALVSGSACQVIQGPRTEKIELTLPSPTLAVGQTMQATAQPQKEDGTPRDRPFSLRSSNPAIATVTSTGLVTAISEGITVITATSDGKSDSDTLRVTPPFVTEVRVTPQFAQLRVGGAPQRLTASAFDITGKPLAGTPRWESSNSSVATVSSDGTVTALAPGQANIIADIGGRTGVANIQVTLIPLQSIELAPSPLSIEVREARPLTITARDTAGRVVSTAGRTVSFTISDQTVVSVNGSGVVTGLREGTANITVTVDGVRRDVAVTVVPQKVAAIVFNTPANVILRRTSTRLLQAFGLDSTTNTIQGLVLSYRSSNPAVASVLPNSGLVTSNSLGTAYIVASAGGKSDSVLVTVTEIPIGLVTVSPQLPNITGGDTQQFTAVVRDTANNIVTGRAITWFSSNPQVLSINATTGLATALALNGGGALVRASVDAVAGQPGVAQGETGVNILPAPVASLVIVPADISIPLGGSRQFTVVARDVRGNELLQRSFTVVAENTQVVQVDGARLLLLAVGPGTTTITAQARNSANNQPDGPPASARVNVFAGAAANRAVVSRTAP